MTSKEHDNMEKINKWLTEGINWLIIFSMVILNMFISVMTFKDGGVALKDYSHFTWLDWVGWGVSVLIPAVLALVVDNSFLREGVRKGEKLIINYVNAYNDQFEKSQKTYKVLSKSEFFTSRIKRKSAKNFMSILVLSAFTGQLVLGVNLENMLKFFINMGSWVILGFIAYRTGYEYAVNDLKQWYIMETAKLREGDSYISR